MEANKSSITKKIGIAATLVSLAGGSVALWNQFKPLDEVPDLSGIWTITNTVESSNLERYVGEVYAFEVYVTQDGAKLTGEGEQTHYNGNVAPSHFPIKITEGSVREDKVIVRYTMKGTRETTGIITLKFDAEGTDRLTGTFASAAADTKGKTVVRIEGH